MFQKAASGRLSPFLEMDVCEGERSTAVAAIARGPPRSWPRPRGPWCPGGGRPPACRARRAASPRSRGPALRSAPPVAAPRYRLQVTARQSVHFLSMAVTPESAIQSQQLRYSRLHRARTTRVGQGGESVAVAMFVAILPKSLSFASFSPCGDDGVRGIKQIILYVFLPPWILVAESPDHTT